jgi:hypothetical protein
MVTDGSMSTTVTIVTPAYAATMETCTAVKSSSATPMTTPLGKDGIWQQHKRKTAGDYETNLPESGFHHFSSLCQKSV